MSKTVPSIAQTAINTITYFKAGEAALNQAEKILPRCRAVSWFNCEMPEFLESRGIENIPLNAAISFALATEAASFNAVMQCVANAIKDARNVIAILSPTTKDHIILDHAPPCAFNQKANHIRNGTQESLFVLQHHLDNLADWLGERDLDNDYDKSDSPLRNGKLEPHPSVQELQYVFDELHYRVAEATARHAGQVIQAFATCQDPARAVNQFKAWESQLISASRREPFLARRAARYELTS